MLVCKLLSDAIWSGTASQDYSKDDMLNLYQLLIEHSVAPLAYKIASSLPIDEKMRKEWELLYIRTIAHYARIKHTQTQLLKTLTAQGIPVVVLKGTAAATYYINPELRTMGDIDLLVRPEFYDQCVNSLLNLGYVDTTNKIEEKIGRHKVFQGKEVVIELHHFFSSDVNGDKGYILDDLIFADIELGRNQLSDPINGLVLLNHLAQHMEAGIGLRQLIDWMMFANSYLDDEKWEKVFRDLAEKTGLDKLAKVATRTCQYALGLRPSITWCCDVDQQLCCDFMNYVLESGNLGTKRAIEYSEALTAIPSLNHPIKLFKELQRRGEISWHTIKNYRNLRPFAWLYQIVRYIKLVFYKKKNKNMIVKNLMSERQRRSDLFKRIGIK